MPQIIFTGRLVPYKGAHVLTGAMGILQRKGISATCTIVGGSGVWQQQAYAVYQNAGTDAAQQYGTYRLSKWQ